ncbi:RNHCP domain-containing protein [Patescibacteria group bacterium]|nr:RNHCP domain-containing protein [Patescibacteria group bacterium]
MSLHVDGEVPGERATDCHGIMKPVELDFKMSG